MSIFSKTKQMSVPVLIYFTWGQALAYHVQSEYYPLETLNFLMERPLISITNCFRLWSVFLQVYLVMFSSKAFKAHEAGYSTLLLG